MNMSYLLGIDLGREQIEALERLRSGRGLTFTLWITGVAEIGGRGYGAPAQTLTIPVNQGTWVELLQAMGYSERLLLEVPLVPTEASPVLTTAFDHLQDSHSLLLRGEWRASVGAVRDVMESVDGILGEKPTPEEERLFDGYRKLDRAGRLRLLRRALRIFAHPSRHAGPEEARIDWSRSDAVMAVSIAGALLARASRGTLETD